MPRVIKVRIQNDMSLYYHNRGDAYGFHREFGCCAIQEVYFTKVLCAKYDNLRLIDAVQVHRTFMEQMRED